MNTTNQYVSSEPQTGFFEEFVEAGYGERRPRGFGVRVVKEQGGRKLGAEGRLTLTLTEPVELVRCFRNVTLKASVKKPVKVVTYLYPIQGRMK